MDEWELGRMDRTFFHFEVSINKVLIVKSFLLQAIWKVKFKCCHNPISLSFLSFSFYLILSFLFNLIILSLSFLSIFQFLFNPISPHVFLSFSLSQPLSQTLSFSIFEFLIKTFLLLSFNVSYLSLFMFKRHSPPGPKLGTHIKASLLNYNDKSDKDYFAQ